VPSRFKDIDLIMSENWRPYAASNLKRHPGSADLIKFIADAKKGEIRPDSGNQHQTYFRIPQQTHREICF